MASSKSMSRVNISTKNFLLGNAFTSPDISLLDHQYCGEL
jgi:hypothetical protein